MSPKIKFSLMSFFSLAGLVGFIVLLCNAADATGTKTITGLEVGLIAVVALFEVLLFFAVSTGMTAFSAKKATQTDHEDERRAQEEKRRAEEEARRMEEEKKLAEEEARQVEEAKRRALEEASRAEAEEHARMAAILAAAEAEDEDDNESDNDNDDDDDGYFN